MTESSEGRHSKGMEGSETTNGGVNFLDLPQEIRDMIYAWCKCRCASIKFLSLMEEVRQLIIDSMHQSRILQSSTSTKTQRSSNSPRSA